MKHTAKKRSVLRPSPNEEVTLLQNEKQKRRKLRLQQVRDQEKAFANKLLQRTKERKALELRQLSENLKEQWQQDQEKKEASLQKKYKENLEQIGAGHLAAREEPESGPRNVLSQEAIQKAKERHRKALDLLMLEKAKDSDAEFEQMENRRRVRQTEQARATWIASLPAPADPVQDLNMTKGPRHPAKSVDTFASSHHHLKVFACREDTTQENARVAAIEEGERIDAIVEESRRVQTEQTEKARLRHNHALVQLHLEEDRKRLMEQLDSLERCDRHRRQEAVAKIPVQIFQPPHKRLEDAEEHQRDLEQAFEDMYMMQTGYTGDLTVALEPRPHATPLPDESLRSDTEPSSLPQGTELADSRPAGSPVGSAAEEGSEKPLAESISPVPRKDPLRRLLRRIQDQRDVWQTRAAHPRHAQGPANQQTAQPAMESSAGAPSLPRPPEPSHHRPIAVPEAPATPAVADRIREAPAARQDPADEGPRGVRTLLHPYEATRRLSSAASAPSAAEEDRREDALLEQQRLKLQLQQQNLIKQQLEQQLREYQRQLQEIYQHPEGSEAPQEDQGPPGQERADPPRGAHPSAPGEPFRLIALEGLSEGRVPESAHEPRVPFSEPPRSSPGVLSTTLPGDRVGVTSPLESLSSYDLAGSYLSGESSQRVREEPAPADHPAVFRPGEQARSDSRSASSSTLGGKTEGSDESSAVTSITVTASLQTLHTPTLSVGSPDFVPPLVEIPYPRSSFSAVRPSGLVASTNQTARPGIKEGPSAVTPESLGLSSAGWSRSTSHTSHHSPSYLDHFRQKLEEERRLLAAQRHLITQRQEQHRAQLMRYAHPQLPARNSTMGVPLGGGLMGVPFADPSNRVYVRLAHQDEPHAEQSTSSTVQSYELEAPHSVISDEVNGSAFVRLPSESLGKSQLAALVGRSFLTKEKTAPVFRPVTAPIREAVRSSESLTSAQELTQSSSGTQYHSLPHSMHSSDVATSTGDTRDGEPPRWPSPGPNASDPADLMTRMTPGTGEVDDGDLRGDPLPPPGQRNASVPREWLASLLRSSEDSSGADLVGRVGSVAEAAAPGISWALKDQDWPLAPSSETSKTSEEYTAAQPLAPSDFRVEGRRVHGEGASSGSSSQGTGSAHSAAQGAATGRQFWSLLGGPIMARSALTPSDLGAQPAGLGGIPAHYSSTQTSTKSSESSPSSAGPHLRGISGIRSNNAPSPTSTMSADIMTPGDESAVMTGLSGSGGRYVATPTSTMSADIITPGEDGPPVSGASALGTRYFDTGTSSQSEGGPRFQGWNVQAIPSPAATSSISTGGEAGQSTSMHSDMSVGPSPPDSLESGLYPYLPILVGCPTSKDGGHPVGQGLRPALRAISGQAASQAPLRADDAWAEPNLWGAAASHAHRGGQPGALLPLRAADAPTAPCPGHSSNSSIALEAEQAFGAPINLQDLRSGEKDTSSVVSSSFATLSSGSLSSPPEEPGPSFADDCGVSERRSVTPQAAASDVGASGEDLPTPGGLSGASSCNTDEQTEDAEEHLIPGVLGGTSLQSAFSRHKRQFVRNSQARVARARASRHQVEPRVQLGKRVKPPAARSRAAQRNA